MNGWFSGPRDEADPRPALHAALRALGVAERQITILDHDTPARPAVRVADPTLLGRLRSRFWHPAAAGPAAREFVVLVHLGEDTAPAEAIEAALRAAGAARVRYFPAGEASHGLGHAA